MRILESHGIATARTLEQKISDAGPFNQRIDPHILTPVRNQLVADGILVRTIHTAPWFHLAATDTAFVTDRLAAQLPTYQAVNGLSRRMGQPLEVAVYRALCQMNSGEFFGRYKDLDAHDDSELYGKEEPPQHIGARELPGDLNLDFIVRHPDAGYLGLECKNVREWLYPQRGEFIATLRKCILLNCVPVIIARRIPFVTFQLFSTCGVIFHQQYNQLFPATEANLAARARDRTLLGYHDVRTGNMPDERLTRFITVNLPQIALEAREKFEAYQDLLHAFAVDGMTYLEFAARVRRRRNGTNEDGDWEL